MSMLLILLLCLVILLVMAISSHELRLRKIGKTGLIIIGILLILALVFLCFHFGAEE